ncbi:MAG: hypothetical protein P1V34_04440, partial [Alphaproteobacteria bacterium]|nr:hypothetical protein [Alphaproteobacteria bacterium]
MRSRFHLFLIVLCLAFSLNSFTAQAQSTDTSSNTLESDVMQLLQEHDAAQQQEEPSAQFTFLAPTPPETFTDETASQMVSTGAQSFRGIQVRDDPIQPPQRDPYFEGTFKPTTHAYLNRTLITYDEGAYAIPGDAAYVGTFHYFGQPTEDWDPFPKGSFVVIGKKVKWDGTSENDIYIAEDAIAGFALHFVPATPDYLKQFETRHAAAVDAYQLELASANDEWDLGQIMALGFGAALIGSSDLPGMDKMNLAQAFISDVTGDGSGTALANLMGSYSGS